MLGSFSYAPCYRYSEDGYTCFFFIPPEICVWLVFSQPVILFHTLVGQRLVKWMDFFLFHHSKRSELWRPLTHPVAFNSFLRLVLFLLYVFVVLMQHGNAFARGYS